MVPYIVRTAEIPCHPGDLPRPTRMSESSLPTDGRRVLIISENVPPQVNGMARRVGQYAEGLRKRGCDVTMLHPDCNSDEVFGFTNPWNFSARMMIVRPQRFIALLRTEFDVVHIVMPLNLSGVWLLAGFKFLRSLGMGSPRLICSWHCNLAAYNDDIFPAWATKIMEQICMSIFLPVAQMADRLLVPTPSTEPLLRAAFGDRWGICSNGLQLNSFNPDARNTPSGDLWMQRKRDALAATGCTHLLLCVGRLSPEKGVASLLASMPLLPGCLLWLVGDGPARKDLETIVADGHDGAPLNVTFWGYQHGEALSAVYTACDCFVCPSLTETFGQTVNEALASGCAVAVPRVGCFAEAYDGVLDKAEHMWTPGDKADMAAAILRQLSPVGMPAVARPKPKLKSWKQACDELLSEYSVPYSRPSSLPTFKEALLLVVYPAFWTFTVIIAFAVALMSFTRTMLGGVGVRTFCKLKAKQYNASVRRASVEVRDGLGDKVSRVRRRMPFAKQAE